MGTTDSMWDGDMRKATVFTRYHVGAPSVGLVETFSRQQEAFECACLHANKNGETTTVFDSMARHGAGELWEFEPSPSGGIVRWKTPSRRKT
jgi:hypothetical protein